MPLARRRRGLSCLLALLLTLALLCGLEGVLRWRHVGERAVPSPFGPEAGLGLDGPLLVPDDELYFRLRPHAEVLGYYRLNAEGWRGPEIAQPKPADTLRIVCTGDSTTFGLGVPEKDMWTAALARLLDAAFEGDVRVEVVSAGVPSYSSAQNRVQVRRDLPALQPDVVVLLATGHNDAVPTSGPTDAEFAAARRGLSGALQSLALVRALHVADDRPSGAGPRPRVSLTEFGANLRDIVAAVREQGGALVLVVPPHSERLVALAPAEGKAEGVVDRVARQSGPGVARADPRADFAALAPRDLFLDGVHPDAAGQRLIALSVAEALVATDGPLGPRPRAAFARAWLGALRHGVAGERETLAGPDVPPRFAALRAQCADSAAFVQALRTPDPETPLPLIRTPDAATPQAWAEALLRLAADDAAATTQQAAAFADETFRFVQPRDPLAALLQSSSTTAPPEGDLALARALVAWQATLDVAPERRDRRLADAAQRLRAGDAPAALALLGQVLALNPRCAEAHYQLGVVLDRLARREEAQAAYDRALALAPDSALGQFLKGKSAWQHGQREAAEPALRAAVALDPALVLARYALGQLLLEQKRFDEAEQQLGIVLALAAGDFTDVPALLQRLRAERAMAQ